MKGIQLYFIILFYNLFSLPGRTGEGHVSYYHFVSTYDPSKLYTFQYFSTKLLNQLESSLARMHNRSWEEDVQICSQLIHQEEEMKEIWTNFLLKNQQNKFHNICFTGLGLWGPSPGS